MPRFKVIQYRDACQRYEVEIDAASAQAALAIAKENDCAWEDCGVSTYDNADMEVDRIHRRSFDPHCKARSRATRRKGQGEARRLGRGRFIASAEAGEATWRQAEEEAASPRDGTQQRDRLRHDV